MTVVVVMITPGRNHVQILDVIGTELTGRTDPTYCGILNGEPICFTKSEVEIYAKKVP